MVLPDSKAAFYYIVSRREGGEGRQGTKQGEKKEGKGGVREEGMRGNGGVSGGEEIGKEDKNGGEKGTGMEDGGGETWRRS